MIQYTWVFVLGALVLMACICILNAITFPRLRGAELDHTPAVSILVPVRDEGEVIFETVSGLLAQDYPDFEVLVLDDYSCDGSAEIAKLAAREDPRFHLIYGEILPADWTGKNWACWQLSQLAQGEILIFADADVQWQQGALTQILAQMEHLAADAITIWPTQKSQTLTERLVVPLMMFSVLSYLPELCVRFVPWRVFTTANGQCFGFRRKTYAQIGGHAAVRSVILEDMALGRRVKAYKLRLGMALGNNQIYGRMYSNWREVREGFGKNIVGGHGGKPILLILSLIFHWMLFLVPWVWLAAGWQLPENTAWPAAPLAMIGLGIVTRALSAAVSRERIRDALWLPLSIILMTAIAGQGLWWHIRGGPFWKGRQLTPSTRNNQAK